MSGNIDIALNQFLSQNLSPSVKIQVKIGCNQPFPVNRQFWSLFNTVNKNRFNKIAQYNNTSGISKQKY